MHMFKRVGLLLLCLMMLVPAAAEEETAVSAPVLELHQMAIGYADGYFIRCGDIEIMIDGGNPDPEKPTDDVVEYLRAVGVEKLDAYIITHWHLDHCMNVNVVLSEFGDENTAVYSPSEEVPEFVWYQPLGKVMMAPLAAGTYHQMKIHDVIQIGDLTITCTGPETVGSKGKHNKDSLNFLIQYGKRRMLFTGDYAHSNEINKYFSEFCRNVDVLKFPHHGGKPYEIGVRASKTVAPTYVLVPSMNNNYGIYRFFVDNDVKIKRENVLTERSGHAVILTDGADYIEARTQQNPADYAPKSN